MSKQDKNCDLANQRRSFFDNLDMIFLTTTQFFDICMYLYVLHPSSFAK